MPDSKDHHKTRSGPQFRFVNVEHPAELNSTKTRREVRSHVTALQHRITRQKKAATAIAPTLPPPLQMSSGSSSTASQHQHAIGEDEAGKTHQYGALNNGPEPSGISADAESSEVAQSTEERPTPGTSNENDRKNEENVLQPESGNNLRVNIPSLVITRAASLANRASRIALLNDPSDTVAKTLGRLQLSIFRVVEHYNWIVKMQATDFEKHFMPDLGPNSGAHTMLPKIFKDPALLSTAALIATGHMLSIRNVAMTSNVARCIFELRRCVFNQINAALRDPKRAMSDPLIVTVLIIASHEGLQGSAENYHIHMQGLVRMINLRGGLTNLNNDQQYMKELVIWQDTNVATILGCKPYHKLTDNSSDAPTVEPNPRLWLLKDS